MKISTNLLILIAMTSVVSCSKDPLSPHSKPVAVLNVRPETAYISNAVFTIDAEGSSCSGVPAADLWARISWNFDRDPDSILWENWTSLHSILTSPPSISYSLDTNQSFPLVKIIALEVANPNGVSDTAVDTVIILKN